MCVFWMKRPFLFVFYRFLVVVVFWGCVPRCCDGHLSQGIPFRLKKVLFSVAQYFKEQCRARAGSFD